MRSYRKKVNIIVPIYDDWSSIKDNISSLKQFYADDESVEVYYVNDRGPNSELIEGNITTAIADVPNFHYKKNSENLGFVKNCNNAVFNKVDDKEADILLLNSDTIVTEGFKEEMVKVLYSDDNICAVNPRGNNATIWSVPMNGSLAHKPKKSYKKWLKLKNQIPDKYISPTVHGFCMLIRREAIDHIGLFDEIYGRGYGEENDFTMRALEAGWKCAVANHAFVYHVGSRSFGSENRDKLSNRNGKILLKRYPNYNTLIAEYIKAHPEPAVVRSHGKIYRIFRLLVSAVEYGYVNGYVNTLRKALSVVRNRMKSINPGTTRPRVQIWTHEISQSGAPLVLFDIIKQWQKKKSLPDNIAFCYPHGVRVDYVLRDKLASEGVDFKPVHVLEAQFNSGDIVILNSTSHHPLLYEKVLTSLTEGVLKHLYFYIHEDDEHTTGATDKYRQTIVDLLNDDRVTIYAPSSQSTANWRRYFGVNKNILSMPGHIAAHNGMFQTRPSSDFSTINFLIAGSREPRKGILNVIHALIAVDKYHIQKNPDHYREFTLTIVGDDHKNDFHNRFIKKESSYFGNKIKLMGNMPQDELYAIVKASNLTITYSLADSLSMVTFEGMAFGHPIIRSEASGKEEQLLEGGNGWLARTSNWGELVDAIEEILNKKKTTNKRLSQMSTESIRIAKENYDSEYRLLDDIKRELS